MKFTIDRSIWLRGEGSDDSYLLRPDDGKMCCVGQMCKQLGVADEDLRLRATVKTLLAEVGRQEGDSLEDAVQRRYEASEQLKKSLNGLIESGSQVAWLSDAYVINDEDSTRLDREEDRETALTELFKVHGHELEFIN